MKTKKDAVDEEARLALQEYDDKLGKLEDASGTGIVEIGTSGGRKVFGAPRAPKKHNKPPTKRAERNNIYNSSDSEADFDMKDSKDEDSIENNELLVTKVEPGSLMEEPKVRQEESVLQVKQIFLFALVLHAPCVFDISLQTADLLIAACH